MPFTLQQLSDIEEIKILKHRYFRGIDTADMALLAGLFTEDVAEVRTTKLISAAAAGMPSSRNMFTKGLSEAETLSHGVTSMITSSDST